MANPQNLVAHRFKPGESGNPGGRPKAVFTKAEAEVLFQKYAKATKAELRKIVEDEDAKLVEIACATAWLKAAATGNLPDLNALLDRAVGKVKDEAVVEQHNHEHKEAIAGVPLKELTKLVSNDK